MLEQSWEKYFQEQQPIQFHFTTRKWVSSTEWTRTWPSIGIRMKTWLWFWFVWIVGIVFQGAWVLYRINKYKGNESLLLLTFWRHDNTVIFLKYLKEQRLSSSHLRIQNIPHQMLLWWHKTLPGAIWTQAYSEPL